MDKKQILTKALKEYIVNVEDSSFPLLNALTERIEIHCNEGSISQIKPTLRVK